MGEFMKKNKAIAIFCLLFMILVTFVVCSSIYLSKKNINKNIIFAAAVQNEVDGGGSSGSHYGLTKSQVENELNALESTPTYDELVKLANDKYGMNEAAFQVAFGWGIGEGYDSAKDDSGNVDHYLGYLCDCIGINFYMGYKLHSADELAAKLRGGDKGYYYYTSTMQKRAQDARDNPNSYVAKYKGMYLALKYPDENAHACYGPTEKERQFYFSQGGEVYYSGGIYRGYRIEVWKQWYRTGFEHWNSDGEYSDKNNSVQGTDKEEIIATMKNPTIRINYADLCKAEGFRTGSKIAGIIILVAKWLAPMILIILGMTDFIKALVSNEDDSLVKATKTFIIRMVIAIIVPFVPGLLYYLVDYFVGDLKDETGELVSCTECLKKPFSCEVELYDYNDQR